MLTVAVGSTEYYNEETEMFEYHGGEQVNFEHSLFSLSKWEAKYEKPFLGRGEKDPEEVLDYVGMMVLPPHDASVIDRLTNSDLEKIVEYIKGKHTATTFHGVTGSKGSGEQITSELVYYWLAANQIPFEVEHWNLNRLFTLLQICSVKNGKQKKLSRAEIAARNREINAQRRAQLGTSG